MGDKYEDKLSYWDKQREELRQNGMPEAEIDKFLNLRHMNSNKFYKERVKELMDCGMSRIEAEEIADHETGLDINTAFSTNVKKQIKD